MLALVACAASWHLPSLSGPIHPPTLYERRPRAQLALQLRPDSPRGLTAEIEALAQRVSAVGRALRGKGPARVPEAEEDGLSCEGQVDPEEAALRRLESDLLAAEAAASELLAAAAEAPTEAEDPTLPPQPSVYTFTPAAGRSTSPRGGPAVVERQRLPPPPPPPPPPLPPRSPLLRVRDRVVVMVRVRVRGRVRARATLTLTPNPNQVSVAPRRIADSKERCRAERCCRAGWHRPCAGAAGGASGGAGSQVGREAAGAHVTLTWTLTLALTLTLTATLTRTLSLALTLTLTEP